MIVAALAIANISHQFHSSTAVYVHFPVQNIDQLHTTIDSFLYLQSDFNASTIQSFISVFSYLSYLSTTLGYFYLLLFSSFSQVYLPFDIWIFRQ